jgi:pumilio RNA-binding family
MQRPLLGLHLNTTPDSSPCSDASSLATPSDLSPARFGLGLKLDSSLGLDLHGQFSHMAPPDHVRDFSAPEFDPYWINQPSVYGQSTLSSFLRPAHSIQSHMGTPAQVPTTLFDSYVDRPSPMSFGGPLPNFPSTTVQPAMSRAFFDQTASPSSPMSPAGHVRGLSTSGWATPRPVVPPGQWLRGGARPELHARAGSYSSASSGGASHTSGQDVSDIHYSSRRSNVSHSSAQPVNFLSLLHPSSAPPYHSFVARVIKSSDQQASIFLQQKLKVAESDERARIIDAICNRGFEMMTHRYESFFPIGDCGIDVFRTDSVTGPYSGVWRLPRRPMRNARLSLACGQSVVQLTESSHGLTRHLSGRVVDLATNCYGCHVLQKALDCEEDLRLLIVSELLLGDPASTLVNKHASHVWSKVWAIMFYWCCVSSAKTCIH